MSIFVFFVRPLIEDCAKIFLLNPRYSITAIIVVFGLRWHSELGMFVLYPSLGWNPSGKTWFKC